MAISSKTRKILWANSGCQCAFPGCKQSLIVDKTVTGEECHIVAKEPGGARYNANLSDDERDGIDNLILLCSVHHKIIDDNEESFTIETLRDMKRQHEQLVSKNKTKKADEEMLLSWVYMWYSDLEVDEWSKWATMLLSNDRPTCTESVIDMVPRVSRFIFTRPWPNHYINVKKAFINFMRKMDSFYSVFMSHSVKRGDEYWTELFYRLREWNPALYNKRLDDYHNHVDNVCNLTKEMTKSANFLCEIVRDELDSSFMMDEGKLMVEEGPDISLNWERSIPEYSDEEKRIILDS